MSGIQDFIADLQTAIGGVRVTFGRVPQCEHRDYPHIGVLPVGEGFAGSQGGGGGNPRVLHTRAVSLDFHCWGIDVTMAEGLMFAVVSAIRQVTGGANYALEGAEWVDPGVMDRGVVVVLRARIIMGMPQATLPLPATGVETDNTLPTARVNSVEVDAQNT
jgi:hypothetical protein